MECKTKTDRTMLVQSEKELLHQTREETDAQAYMIPLLGFEDQMQGRKAISNNLTEYEWAIGNKIYPNFGGRSLNADKYFTQADIDFVRKTGIIIAAVYNSPDVKKNETQGRAVAMKINSAASKMHIPNDAVIFLEINDDEYITTEYMLGYIDELAQKGYIPAFKANPKDNYRFASSFKNGMKERKELFAQCMVWSVIPTFKEYEYLYFSKHNLTLS